MNRSMSRREKGRIPAGGSERRKTDFPCIACPTAYKLQTASTAGLSAPGLFVGVSLRSICLFGASSGMDRGFHGKKKWPEIHLHFRPLIVRMGKIHPEAFFSKMNGTPARLRKAAASVSAGRAFTSEHRQAPRDFGRRGGMTGAV